MTLIAFGSEMIFILKLLPSHYLHKRHYQYLEIEQPRAVLQIEEVVAEAAEHFLDGVGISII